MNKLICHMTHWKNLSAIVKNDGLFCKNELSCNGISFEDIANANVQDKRAKTTVPLEPQGTLHDYVPFYFWGTTPMLYANKPKQNDIIFLVAKTNDILKSGISFVFTDRHAVTRYVSFYNNLNDLNKLDWESIESKYWKEPEDREEKNRQNFLFIRSSL